ncbi:hypothetical protein RRG08_036751 [Elysia crispata]|uniref:LIM zinc-binding domain-containing protein n=1 Tax=Elysia crispata TaxID=231223 RepID=A0AAE1DFV4_9GAST|nr:hypothetical protein RRG08_036751 [Elysia crispata]
MVGREQSAPGLTPSSAPTTNGGNPGCGTPVSAPSGREVCAGCGAAIADRYLLKVLDESWHEACLQCSLCRVPLSGSCFSRDRKLYCRHDYDNCPGHTVRYLLPPVRQPRDLVLSTALAYYLGRALTARPLSGVRVAREIELQPWGGTRKTVFQFL